MADYRIRRAESMSVLPRYPSSVTQRSPSLQRVRRVYSVPNLTVNDLYLTGRYVPSSTRPYNKLWSSDDFWYYYYGTRYNPYSTPFYPASYRIFRYVPSTTSYDYYALPSSWYSGPRYYSNYYDPYNYLYSRPSYYDYDYPWYNPYRSRYYENLSTRRATELYNRGLINYSALNKYWLSPYTWDRPWSTLRDMYVPSGYYGPRYYGRSWIY